MTQDNLRDVIGLRMQLAREALEMAEEHRDEVWVRLRSRMSGLEDGPKADPETEHATPSAGWNGPERRRSPAEPMYANEEKPLSGRLRWPRLGLAHAAGAGLLATALAAAITLS